MDIQWFPGHMTKAKRMVKENLKLVDIVLELLDARLPLSSRNPMINDILGEKPRIIILNKYDLANPQMNKAWEKYFKNTGVPVALVNSITGDGVSRISTLAKSLMAEKMAAKAKKGMRPRAIRAMIVGIPNVGKSSLINKLAGRSKTKTEDRPGVTRGQQWIRINNDFELLDTPGILWPKFEDQNVGFKLAVTGSIKEDILDIEEIAKKLLALLKEVDPEGLQKRYKIDNLPEEPQDILAAIAIKRGCLLQGGTVDYLSAAHILLSEYRGGKIGQYTLDKI